MADDIKKRGAVRGSVTRLISKLEVGGVLDAADTDMLLSRKEVVDLQAIVISLKDKKEILAGFDEIVFNAIEDEEKYEEELDGVDQYMMRINSTICQLQDTILYAESKLKTAVVTARMESKKDVSHVRLPKLTLVQFTGDILLWNQFWDSFKSSIHSNDSLSPVDKFGYLLTALSLDVRKCIAGLSVTGENYDLAVTTLTKRYGNVEVIKREHMKRLQEMKYQNNTAKGLRLFYDEVHQHVFGLDKLGIAMDQYEVMLIPLYLSRIDPQIHMELIKASNSNLEIESLNEFLDLLDRYILLLERVNLKPEAVKSGNPSQPSPKFSFATNGTVNDQNRVKKCGMCNALDHYIQDCKAFCELKPSKRFSFAQDNNLCYNCLIKNHRTNACRRDQQCKQCKGKHHPLLHDPEKTKPSIPDKTTLNEDKSNAKVMASYSTSKVHLQTVPVKIELNGSYILTNALLDTASDICVVSNEIAAKFANSSETRKLSIQTVNGAQKHLTGIIKNLTIEGLSGGKVTLPEVYNIDNVSLGCRQIEKVQLQQYDHLKHLPINYVDAPIGLLIGACVPEVFVPLDHKTGTSCKDPVGILGVLGWSILGAFPAVENTTVTSEHRVNYISGSSDLLMEQVKQFWNIESLGMAHNFKKDTSIEDQRALDILENSVTLQSDNHYQMKLPWKNLEPDLPCNKSIAVKRAHSLKRAFLANPDKFEKYKEIIHDYVDKGFAIKVPEDKKLVGLKWYIPHHAVTHPKKGKLRVVFDCAAKFNGISLNSMLLSGPDLTSSLISVLMRFRTHQIAVMADIEGMFHQVRVDPGDVDALRFLWWKDDNLSEPLEEYQMTVHIFGATSSPTCANFALQKTADDNKNDFPLPSKLVHDNFYVDDFLWSTEGVASAISMVGEMTELTSKGGFRLTKWVSNSKDVLNTIPKEMKAKSVANLDLNTDCLPNERTLGLLWNTDSDLFIFTFVLNDHPLTRRGILSAVSSIYDPLGLVSPLFLPAKLLLQELCSSDLGWDDELSEEQKKKWITWKENVAISGIPQMRRCYVPIGFGQISGVELHTFCDASELGYGCATYLRFADIDGNVCCTLVMGKSRVAPLKRQTIPRLELQSALIGARLSRTVLECHTELKITSIRLWTDSTVVLHYLTNEKRRFKTFIANRVAEIRELTDKDQWFHVPSGQNPADCASRGMEAHELDGMWLTGPSFLTKSSDSWPAQTWKSSVSEILEEEKQQVMSVEVIQPTPTDSLINYYSSWDRLLKCVIWMTKFKLWLQNRKVEKHISCRDYANAEKDIIMYVQHKSFPEVRRLKQHPAEHIRHSKLQNLNPYMRNDILVVGGRVKGLKQAILPKFHHVTSLIIRHTHVVHGHSGREYILSILRRRYWIINGKTVVRKVLADCITCKKWHGKLMTQQMADLPDGRISPLEPPFTSTGVDYFGPICVRFGRGTAKRYGCLFTCLRSRAIHLELSHSLSSSSFIQSFQRFVARRGKPRDMYSDNGTNLVGAECEMRKDIQQWNSSVPHFMAQNNINWHFNPPEAPHMGGIWERLVQETKKLMRITANEQLLNDEGLVTLLVQVESMLNNRPITSLSDDPNDLQPLTPNSLLLQSGACSIPIGLFDNDEQFSRRLWKQVQYLSQVFWKRWLLEYRNQLQKRSKWLVVKRNIQKGDMVLVEVDARHRGYWPLGRIIETFPGKDGLVRTCSVKTNGGVFKRAIHKLVFLEASAR